MSRRPSSAEAIVLRDPAPSLERHRHSNGARPSLAGLDALDLGDPRWRSLVAASPEATSFHNPAWAQLLADCYGYRPFVLAALDSRGELQAGLPFLETTTLRGKRRWVSLPFSDMVEPLAADPAALAALVGGLEPSRVEAGIERVEIRADLDVPEAVHTSPALRHVLDLDRNEDEVYQRLSRSQVQRNIARAVREGVVVRVGESRADLDETFFALQIETRRRLGVPVQPRRFYTLLWERMIEPGDGFLLLAYAGKVPIGGAVFLSAPHTLTFKFGASLKSHWPLRGNQLIFWTAIQHGCATGAEKFDFGRTELRHEGLRTFKRNWGTRELPLRYTVAGAAHRESSVIARSALAGVIRYSPSFVCRALGATFYKYA
jgi:CelD/BcsL family acetyltransferase involved in cellulose biosynthesis